MPVTRDHEGSVGSTAAVVPDSFISAFNARLRGVPHSIFGPAGKGRRPMRTRRAKKPSFPFVPSPNRYSTRRRSTGTCWRRTARAATFERSQDKFGHGRDVRVQQRSVSVETLKAIADAFNAYDLDAIMEFLPTTARLTCRVDGSPGGSALRAKPPCARD